MMDLLAHLDCVRVLAQAEHNRHCDEIKEMTKREQVLVKALRVIGNLYSIDDELRDARIVAQEALEELGL